MKIFIYCDKTDKDQEPFLSGMYKNERDFYKVNPDFFILKSFNAEGYLDLLKKQSSLYSKKDKRGEGIDEFLY